MLLILKNIKKEKIKNIKVALSNIIKSIKLDKHRILSTSPEFFLFRSNVAIKSYSKKYRDRPFTFAIFNNGDVLKEGMISADEKITDSKIDKLIEVYLQCLMSKS